MEDNFIKTSDKKTADALINEGFTLFSKNNNVWTFINDTQKKMNFSGKKIVYTNNIEI